MVIAETFDTVGCAGTVAALASPPAIASTSPTGTVAPARTQISPMQPSAAASIALATFSVSTTNRTSPCRTR
jgi:hypothetical protein